MQRLALHLPQVRLAALFGIGVALVIGGGWMALTAWTGKTYHLAALLGTLAPALTTRAVLDARLGVLRGFALGIVGAARMGMALIAGFFWPLVRSHDRQKGVSVSKSTTVAAGRVATLVTTSANRRREAVRVWGCSTENSRRARRSGLV